MSDPLTPRQRQVQFALSRRSMREIEEIFAGFAHRGLVGLNDHACGRILALLEYPDWDLWNWLTKLSSPPPEVDAEVLEWLRTGKTDPATGHE